MIYPSQRSSAMNYIGHDHPRIYPTTSAAHTHDGKHTHLFCSDLFGQSWLRQPRVHWGRSGANMKYPRWFNRVFHYKPSILVVFPLFLETPNCFQFVTFLSPKNGGHQQKPLKGHVNSPSQRDHFESPWSLILLSNISNCSKYPTNGQMLDRNLARLHTGCWKTAPMLPSNVANNLKISWNQRCVLHNTTNWPPNTGSAQDTTNVEKRLTVPRRRSSSILMDWRR